MIGLAAGDFLWHSDSHHERYTRNRLHRERDAKPKERRFYESER